MFSLVHRFFFFGSNGLLCLRRLCLSWIPWFSDIYMLTHYYNKGGRILILSIFCLFLASRQVTRVRADPTWLHSIGWRLLKFGVWLLHSFLFSSPGLASRFPLCSTHGLLLHLFFLFLYQIDGSLAVAISFPLQPVTGCFPGSLQFF